MAQAAVPAVSVLSGIEAMRCEIRWQSPGCVPLGGGAGKLNAANADKAASIEFLKPGRGRVSARFHVSPETVEEIRAAADRDGKTEPVLTVEVVADDGEVVARVTKTLWVKRKDAPKPPGRDVPGSGAP